MIFEQALQIMRDGKKVKLKEEEPIYYIEDNTIMEDWKDLGEVSTLLNPYQILSNKWKVVEDDNTN